MAKNKQGQQVESDFEFDAPDAFDQGMGNPMSGGGVELPFSAPFLSWFNGAGAYKKHDALAAYTGGWSMWEESAVELETIFGAVSSCFERADGLINKDEEEYTAYLAQWLPCAIMGERTRWIRGDNDKMRSHTQVLVFTGDPILNGRGQVEVINAYAPMVLTVKGWQSDYLKKAIKFWSSQTHRARALAGKGKPLHVSLFYMTLGVMGRDRQTETVGAGDGKAIVPVRAIVPPDGFADAASLRMFYVGREAAEQMLQLKEQAREWLEDPIWKSGRDGAAVPAGADNMPPPPGGPSGEDEFPF